MTFDYWCEGPRDFATLENEFPDACQGGGFARVKKRVD